MSDQHKAVVRAIYEQVFNNADHGAISRYYTDHVVSHDPAYGPMKGHATLASLLETFRTAMPDVHYDVLGVIAEGDHVAAHWRAKGTFTGPFMGQAPTGKPFDVTGLSYMRMEGGRVAEVWQHWDQANFAKQLGFALDTKMA